MTILLGPEGQTLLKAADAARLLGISCSTLGRLRRAGKVPFVRLSAHCIRYPYSVLEKLVQDQLAGVNPAA